ncbi:MAG: hypothetical protein AAGB48_07150 [Planctomycetota bacterium]
MTIDRLLLALPAAALMSLQGGVAAAQAEATQPAAAQPDTEAESESEQPAADLPDGFDILDKHLEASGGAEAGLKVQAMRMLGDFAMPAIGMGGTITISMQAPNSQIINVSLGGMGTMVQGTNGEAAWRQDPGMPMRMLRGPEAEQMIEQAKFHAQYAPREQYTSATTLGTEEMNGEPHYRVGLVSAAGNESVGFYSVRTGLRYMERQVDPDTGAVASEIAYEDYRTIDGGLVMPFKMSISSGGIQQVITYTEIQVDPEFDSSTFDAPGDL